VKGQRQALCTPGVSLGVTLAGCLRVSASGKLMYGRLEVNSFSTASPPALFKKKIIWQNFIW